MSPALNLLENGTTSEGKWEPQRSLRDVHDRPLSRGKKGLLTRSGGLRFPQPAFLPLGGDSSMALNQTGRGAFRPEQPVIAGGILHRR